MLKKRDMGIGEATLLSLKKPQLHKKTVCVRKAHAILRFSQKRLPVEKIFPGVKIFRAAHYRCGQITDLENEGNSRTIVNLFKKVFKEIKRQSLQYVFIICHPTYKRFYEKLEFVDSKWGVRLCEDNEDAPGICLIMDVKQAEINAQKKLSLKRRFLS